MSGPSFFVGRLTIHYRSPFLERAQEQCRRPIITSTKIFQLLPELLYALFSRPLMRYLISLGHLSQIFESGTASTLSLFDAYRETPSWMLFANSIQSCATASANNTFSCLKSASSSDLLAAIGAGLALELYPFQPVLDGPGGIVSDYPAKRLSRGAGGRVPLMIGTNLDEGLFPRSRRTLYSCKHRDTLHCTTVSD